MQKMIPLDKAGLMAIVFRYIIMTENAFMMSANVSFVGMPEGSKVKVIDRYNQTYTTDGKDWRSLYSDLIVQYEQ